MKINCKNNFLSFHLYIFFIPFLQRHPRNKTHRSVRLEVHFFWAVEVSVSETWRRLRRIRLANRIRCVHRRYAAATVETADGGCPTFRHPIWKWWAYSGQRLRTLNAVSAWCVPWWTNSSECHSGSWAVEEQKGWSFRPTSGVHFLKAQTFLLYYVLYCIISHRNKLKVFVSY